MTDRSDLEEILKMLHARTMHNQLKWELTGSNTIFTRAGSNLIEMMEVQPDQVYSMSVRNQNGVTLSSTIFANNPLASETFRVVKRAALGVDEALRDVKTFLKEI